MPPRRAQPLLLLFRSDPLPTEGEGGKRAFVGKTQGGLEQDSTKPKCEMKRLKSGKCRVLFPPKITPVRCHLFICKRRARQRASKSVFLPRGGRLGSSNRAGRLTLKRAPSIFPKTLMPAVVGAEMGAQLGSSVAFSSGCAQALPGVPRKAPLCSLTRRG